jgi:hypothetical protein
VEFTLHGSTISRMSPVFKLKEWKGAAPKAILLAGATLAEGRDFSASVDDGTLILQLLKTVSADAEIAIRGDIAPPAEPESRPAKVQDPPAVPAPVQKEAPENPAKDIGKVDVSDIVEKLIFDAAGKMISRQPQGAGQPGYYRGCRIELVKDCPAAEGRTALRIDIMADGFQVGMKEIAPDLGVWAGYEYLTFDVYNPQKDMNDLVWKIGGPGVKTKDGNWSKEMLLRPGSNRVEIQLSGAPVDWTQAISRWELSQFQMSTSVGTTLYLTNFRLEKGDVRARRQKGVNIIDIESKNVFHVFK